MSVLVDTSVWSLLFRRANSHDSRKEHLDTLVKFNETVIIGLIRQELLSGISSQNRFQALKLRLSTLEDRPVLTSHHELAAELANRCQRAGIQGSVTDFLICAVAMKGGLPIFTADRDFERFATYLPISLYWPDN